MSQGNISSSMRQNYKTHGVGEYYKQVHESYRNPHFEGVKKTIHAFLDAYWREECSAEPPSHLRVLDLAAGSGEGTEAVESWRASRWARVMDSAASSAATPSVAPPRLVIPMRLPPGQAQTRPQETSSRQPVILNRAVARPGPAKTSLPGKAPELSIVATDPFTAAAYESKLDEKEGGVKEFDVCLISFALHLVETTSEIWALLSYLSERCTWLVVIAPHKRPEVKDTWGWTQWDPNKWTAVSDTRDQGETDTSFQIVLDRVRLRCWKTAHIKE